MGFEAYDRAEEKYQVDVDRLSEIAVQVYHSDRDAFLKAMADAWLKADPSDKRILRPAWVAIVIKHGLAKEAEG